MYKTAPNIEGASPKNCDSQRYINIKDKNIPIPKTIFALSTKENPITWNIEAIYDGNGYKNSITGCPYPQFKLAAHFGIKTPSCKFL